MRFRPVALFALLGLVAMLAVLAGTQPGSSGSAGGTALAQQATESGEPGSELLEQYPLGEKKLQRDQEEQSASPAARAQRRPADEDDAPIWPFIVGPILLAGALFSLAVYARGGAANVYGYSPDVKERPRRPLSRRTLRMLSPLFGYDHPRDAWILRAIGGRRGPVLKLREAEPEVVPAPVVPSPQRRVKAVPMNGRSADAKTSASAEPASPAPASKAEKPQPEAKPAAANGAAKPESPAAPKAKPKARRSGARKSKAKAKGEAAKPETKAAPAVPAEAKPAVAAKAASPPKDAPEDKATKARDDEAAKPSPEPRRTGRFTRKPAPPPAPEPEAVGTGRRAKAARRAAAAERAETPTLDDAIGTPEPADAEPSATARRPASPRKKPGPGNGASKPAATPRKKPARGKRSTAPKSSGGRPSASRRG